MKTVRTWLGGFVALFALLLGTAAMATSCPSPTYSGVTGLNASSTSVTAASINQSSQQFFAHVDHGYNGSTYVPLVMDGSCNLAVSTPDAMLAPVSTTTRPANTTAYVAGYLVANSTTAGSVTPYSWSGLVRAAGLCARIERFRVAASATTLTNASFKIFLFTAAPVPTVGDGAAFDNAGVLATSGALTLVGTFSTTLANSGSDGAVGWAVPSVGNGVTACPASGTTLYALVEATAAYTPASGETISLYPETLRQ